MNGFGGESPSYHHFRFGAHYGVRNSDLGLELHCVILLMARVDR